MKRHRPWRRVFGPHPDEELDEELTFHLEERIREYVSQGMSPDDARRTAAEKFGDAARVRAACSSMLAADRAAEARRTFANVSWLDVKLGLRMFAKYPGLSLVAVAGMAIAIAIGAGYFSIVGIFLDSSVPLEQGDRIVVIKNRHVSGPNAGPTGRLGEPGAAVEDLVQWRDQVKSITELSAFRDDTRNLITDDGRTELIRVATMTASGFELTRVPAALGRTLLAEDEHPTAPPVTVIGHDLWQRRFNGDPNILGTAVRFDESVHTIVGVMPEGFGFPIRHAAWLPLRVSEIAASPSPLYLHAFGRLADGSSLSEARAELAAVGDRMAVAFPQTHGTLRPQVMPYTQAFIGIEGPEMELQERALQLGACLLLVIVAVNVAILVYARTATRFGEITVRTALGATRGRVIMQLFVEAMVLSVAAAGLGLTLLYVAFRILGEYQKNSPDPDSSMPYWIVPALSPGVIAYVAVLTILAAIVVGVLPALKATGKRVQQGLQQFSARSAGMQLGRTWTALIILQVALAVAALPVALYNAEWAYRVGRLQPDATAHQMLKGRLATSRPLGASSNDTRYADRMATLIQRLQQDPEVAAVTYAERFPGTSEWRPAIEAEPAGAGHPATAGLQQPVVLIRSRVNLVAPNLFDVFDVRPVAGRGFVASDTLPRTAAAIVDQAFADRLAPGENIVGRRVRFPSPDGATDVNPWMEIVGVVPVFWNKFSAPGQLGSPLPSLYIAGGPGRTHPASIIVRVKRGDPKRYRQTLEELTAAVDPTLRLEDVMSVTELWGHDTRAYRMFSLAVAAVTASVLLLSAAGIYAMMSFTVARRWREIGIRVALGADTRRVLMGIFGRASAQIGAGVAAGLIIAAIAEFMTPGGNIGGRGLVFFPAVVVVMSLVGLVAAFGPARRGLAVQPTEALRNE